MASSASDAALAGAGLTFAIIAILALACSGFCAWLADEKGRSVGAWLFLGLLFGPLALLAIVGAPVLVNRQDTDSRVPRTQDTSTQNSQQQAVSQAQNLTSASAAGIRRSRVASANRTPSLSPEQRAIRAANRARREELQQRRVQRRGES